MGASCCCLRDEFEDFSNPNGATNRHCICLRCFMQNFLHMYTSLFQREEEHDVPSSTQGTASLSSTTPLDHSLADMYRSPPRPLPYDADLRHISLQRVGLVSGKEKGSSHLHEEMEPLRRTDGDEELESLGAGSKLIKSAHEEGSKEYNSKISSKLSTAKITSEFPYMYSSPEEEEDVCPTCLEEYTEENPKIITKCSHHFHLGCIYEWMERSETCPVCGKVMVFDETT